MCMVFMMHIVHHQNPTHHHHGNTHVTHHCQPHRQFAPACANLLTADSPLNCNLRSRGEPDKGGSRGMKGYFGNLKMGFLGGGALWAMY